MNADFFVGLAPQWPISPLRSALETSYHSQLHRTICRHFCLYHVGRPFPLPSCFFCSGLLCSLKHERLLSYWNYQLYSPSLYLACFWYQLSSLSDLLIGVVFHFHLTCYLFSCSLVYDSRSHFVEKGRLLDALWVCPPTSLEVSFYVWQKKRPNRFKEGDVNGQM